MSETTPLLRMTDIVKTFPGVRALARVSLELYPGEVLGLMGENGAGKSTLMKVLSGAHQPDSGSIEVAGKPVSIDNPQRAAELGISIIYQELNMIPAMSARENLFLGRERNCHGFISLSRERKEAKALFERVGISVDPELPVKDLSVAHHQGIEIAKALLLDAKILVMDEPTAALTQTESDALFRIVNELRAQGLGIIYISHRLEEVLELSDRVAVLRDGESVGVRTRENLDRQTLIEMMVGRRMDQEFPPRNVKLGPVRLEVKDLNRGDKVKDISFSVRAGEVVGLVGLVGAGRTETARLLFGADRPDSGVVSLDGKLLNIKNPRDSIRSRIALLTEDRKTQGLVLIQSVKDNFSLPNLNQFSRFTFINSRKERAAFGKYVDSIRIKIPNPDQLAKNLSGGNQQKVVLAKWLQANCEAVIFDEPTRGVDVGAKYEIYQIINELAAQGKAIVMICSELPEALGMADRLLVMREGRIAGEIASPKSAAQADVLKLAVAAE